MYYFDCYNRVTYLCWKSDTSSGNGAADWLARLLSPFRCTLHGVGDAFAAEDIADKELARGP